MAKRPSLSHQFWQELESKKAIGESRHQAKMQAKEQGFKVETIHSYGTYSAYKQASKTFCKWVKTEFQEVRNLSDIDKDICVMYIQHRAGQGVSAYTYSQDMAMINKCLDLGLTKSYCGVSKRSLSAITKNRTDSGFRTATGALETIIKGSGLRRNELYNLKKENLLISNNRIVGVVVSSGAKGGRGRTVEVRRDFQEPIFKLVQGTERGEKVVKEVIPKRLQTHRLRAEYAQNMIIELKALGRKDPYKDLTKSMGHNRTSVLIYYGVRANK